MQRLRNSTVASTRLSNFPRFLSLFIPRSQTSIRPAVINGEVDLLHAEAIKTGKFQNLEISNYLLTLYVRRQNLDQARNLFDEIPIRDVRSWTILLTGFAKMGLPEMALGMFIEMQNEGVCPNDYTLSCVLKCCASVKNLHFGQEIHGWMLVNGQGGDVALENSLFDFYVKCQVFDYARRVFDLMTDKNTLSWNIMIRVCLQKGHTEAALDLFRRLPSRDVGSWNTIIVGQMRNGHEKMALELLYEMCRSGVVFNEIAYSTALLLVASQSVLEIGRQVHGNLVRRGYDENKFIRNSLIDMYCKCGEMEKASTLFNRKMQNSGNIHTSKSNCGLLETNVSWSSLVSGYVQNGRTEEAFELFRRMVYEAVQVDPYTITSIIAACADVGIPEWGREVHALIEKLGYNLDEFLVSAIIDMYAKCGSLEDALSLFHRSNSKNIVVWTSMISGCALHGRGREAIRLFQLMLKKGIKPNEISFIGVLSGCSHAGLVEEGQFYFRAMQEEYGIVPRVEHFTCMVDLLGRAGRLNDAKEFIYKNNICHRSAVWKTLLSACKIHQDIELGKWVTEQLLKIEPYNTDSYVLISNICATTHRWKEAAETRSLMQKKGFKKLPGQSWIRLGNRVHTFVAGDRSHYQSHDIHSYLEWLIGKLKEVGYSTDTSFAMHDVEEEQREAILGVHSEKLAIAYGIMSTPRGSPILVMKNLRVCVDCHTAIKYISQLTGRKITVRDARRFHHFSGGNCSCNDYW